MKIAQTVAEILDSHVTLEVECIDRMYLNLYVPGLQHVNGAVGFFRYHRKQAVASTALMRPISEKFVSAIESFIEDHQIPVVEFRKGERKDIYLRARVSAALGGSWDFSAHLRAQNQHSPLCRSSPCNSRR